MHSLAAAAMYTDVEVDVLGLITEALRVVPEDPPTRLRAQLSNAHASASAIRLRDEDAVRWATEAIRLAEQLGLPDVGADATTTLVRLRERKGDTDASLDALRLVVDDARRHGEAAAELRGRFNLAALHYEAGELPAAYEAYEQTSQRAVELGRPWGPYGLDARAMAALTAFGLGEWDTAGRLSDVSGETAPGLAAPVLGAVALSVAAGRGDPPADQTLAELRPWWDCDGMIAVVGAGAAIDLHGDHGDLAAARPVHDDAVTCVAELWRQPEFEARIRLSALLLGQLATHTAHTPTADRHGLVETGLELADAAAAAAGRSLLRRPVRGVESTAWLARVEAELARLRWMSGIDVPELEDLQRVWRESVEAFECFGHVYETARSRSRLAAVLHASGSPDAAAESAAARRVAEQLGARPLLRELRLGGGPSSPSEGQRRDLELTAREREVLGLVAEGRSNKQIAERLYISAKTVSVHVSNILGKLGAAGRTEAAAVARRQGLLDAER